MPSGSESSPQLNAMSSAIDIWLADYSLSRSPSMQCTPTLLGLPVHLRKTISELVIDPSIRIHLPCSESVQPSLARVNRHFRSEVLPLWRHLTLTTVTIVSAEVYDFHFERLVNFIRAFPVRSVTVQIDLSFPNGDDDDEEEDEDEEEPPEVYRGADLSDWLNIRTRRGETVDTDYTVIDGPRPKSDSFEPVAESMKYRIQCVSEIGSYGGNGARDYEAHEIASKMHDWYV